MRTLKSKMELRNLSLWIMYWVVRPTMWVLAWCFVDFKKLIYFRMLTENGHRLLDPSVWERFSALWNLCIWPMILPLFVMWFLDVFFLKSWFKTNIVKVSSDSI